MRTIYSFWYIVLIAALLVCTVLAHRSPRTTHNAVAFLECALIPPIIGNLLLVTAQSEGIAVLGGYLYHIGMDLVMYALVNFTDQYCKGTGDGSHKPTVVYWILGADALQYTANLFLGCGFGVITVDVAGTVFYKLVPLLGQTLHRIVMYLVFFCVLLIFILVARQVPKISRERFSVLIFVMITVGVVQTYNIIFRTAIDRSMFWYAIFGLIIYYFAICYRPLRLLDRMLSHIISNLSDAFYVFDPNGKCIWANDEGCRLTGITEKNYEAVTRNLLEMFGNAGDPSQHSEKRKVGEGADARFYVLEENRVWNNKGNIDGTYLRIQDVTEGEQELQARDAQIGQISQAAYRDPLTGVGSKAAYIKKVRELNEEMTASRPEFAVAMVDMNNLKQVNDDYGHKAGDLYIKGCCHLICEAFKHSPVFRVGGDEFVAILQGQDYGNRILLAEQLRAAFAEAFGQTEQEPWLRYSAAVGMAENAPEDNTFEPVFRRADTAMYAEKKLFKQQNGSYR